MTPRARNSLIAVGLAAAAVAAAFPFWSRPGSGVAPVRAPGQEGAVPGAPEASARRPDLLLVVYDARRRDDFSFGPFGNKRGDTPFLAAFSREALLFEDAVSPGAWTAPVHASMFSGRSVCELGIDFYNPGYAAFDASHLSLAEALGMAGYQTVAWADHPYFFNRDTRVSLIRGFEQFDVINDFERYASHTNVGTPGGATERRYDLAGLPALGQAEIAAQLDGFKRGELRFDLAREADLDPATGLYFARLEDLYRDSAYFTKRYRDDFDAHVFAGTRTRPFFLFVNLHMCDVALPDPGLFSRWLLRTVLMNAQSRGIVPEAGGLASRLPELTPALQKQAFDNRFYDATFRALWEYLEKRGLTRNLVSVVTSDHGVSFGEKGESFHLHAGARAYEYISRVPLLVRFPAGSPLARWHGRRTEKVSLTDVFKTLVDLALGPGSFRADPPLRSRSLVERLERNEFDEVLVSESALVPDSYRMLPDAAGYSRAVYQGTLKLLEAPELYRMSRERVTGLSRIGPAAGESRLAPLLELYDLAADPHERRDLAAQRPEQVARLRRATGDWSCAPLASSSARPEWDPEALKTLRALGYIH